MNEKDFLHFGQIVYLECQQTYFMFSRGYPTSHLALSMINSIFLIKNMLNASSASNKKIHNQNRELKDKKSNPSYSELKY